MTQYLSQILTGIMNWHTGAFQIGVPSEHLLVQANSQNTTKRLRIKTIKS